MDYSVRKIIGTYIINLDGLHVIWTCTLDSKQSYLVFTISFIRLTAFFYKLLISRTDSPLPQENLQRDLEHLLVQNYTLV